MRAQERCLSGCAIEIYIRCVNHSVCALRFFYKVKLGKLWLIEHISRLQPPAIPGLI